MRYHKAHLTRRLILDISADSEIEENMVEWLRVRTGTYKNAAVFIYLGRNVLNRHCFNSL